MEKSSDGQCGESHSEKWDKDRLIRALKSGAEKRKQGKMLNVEEVTAFVAVAIHIGTILQLYEQFYGIENSDTDGKSFTDTQVYGSGGGCDIHALCKREYIEKRCDQAQDCAGTHMGNCEEFAGWKFHRPSDIIIVNHEPDRDNRPGTGVRKAGGAGDGKDTASSKGPDVDP